MRVNEQDMERGRVVLRAEEVWKSYDEGTITVLKGIDFEAIEGQTVALCGPSGCGKSTLLHLFGGLDEPDRGQVTMTTHFMRSYSKLAIKTCHRRRVWAMGGMSAFIPIKTDAAANERALPIG